MKWYRCDPKDEEYLIRNEKMIIMMIMTIMMMQGCLRKYEEYF